jgi:fructose transport system permease protein
VRDWSTPSGSVTHQRASPADGAPSAPEPTLIERRSFGARRHFPEAVVARIPTLGPLCALVILTAAFGSLSPVFLTWRNGTQLLQQVMEVGTLAVGQTLIILTGGIDLANGAIMVFGTIVMAKLATSQHWPVLLAIAAGLAVTTLLSLADGAVIAGLTLPPFIVTLGMLNVMYAATLLYSGGTEIQGLPQGLLSLDNSFAFAGKYIPYGPMVMLAVFVFAWYIVRETAWGRHLRAIGSNPQTARVAGVRVKLHLLSVYALAGLIYGFAALLVIARTAIADPLAGQTDNLDSIAAVVIGGTSLFGGRGSIMATLVGVLIVGEIENGLTLVGIDALYRYIATGLIVVGAVAVDQAARRHRSGA